MATLRTTVNNRVTQISGAGWRMFEWLPSAAARTTILTLFTLWLVYLIYLRLWIPLSSVKQLPDEVSETEVMLEVDTLQHLLTQQQERKAHVPILKAPSGLIRP